MKGFLKYYNIDRNKILCFAAGFIVIIFLITFIILLFNNNHEKNLSLLNVKPVNDKHSRLLPSDFIFPVLSIYENEAQYYILRKRLKKWDKQQVEKYWIKPSEIIFDILSNKNNRTMEELFETIP